VIAGHRQPDPSKGVFETLLVVNGAPIELEDHLARLRRSLAEVYGAELPAAAAERVRSAATDVELGRLRLTAAPGEGGLELDVVARPLDPAIMFPPASQGATLRRVNRPGGHGPHKWVDRVGMDRPEQGPGQLICDGEEPLEAGWANLFSVREETLWTPPLDGRILAGMARAAVIAIARDEAVKVHERPLRMEGLIGADEVFLTNSVRGIEPALALDGRSLAGCGPLSRRLAGALRRRWGLPDAAGDLPAPAVAPIPGPPAH
jgi:branched-subunit amino acid aminotransferase/4-amino-4-deoxychorismate lyase